MTYHQGSTGMPQPQPDNKNSVGEYLQPQSPGTPYFPVNDTVDEQQDNLNPANHLARLTTNTF